MTTCLASFKAGVHPLVASDRRQWPLALSRGAVVSRAANSGQLNWECRSPSDRRISASSSPPHTGISVGRPGRRP